MSSSIHLPALSGRVPSVTDGEREIFTARQALQSKAGDFNAPHGLSVLQHCLKALDVGISNQPHGLSIPTQSSHYTECFSNLLAIKLFDQLTLVCPRRFQAV